MRRKRRPRGSLGHFCGSLGHFCGCFCANLVKSTCHSDSGVTRVCMRGRGQPISHRREDDGSKVRTKTEKSLQTHLWEWKKQKSRAAGPSLTILVNLLGIKKVASNPPGRLLLRFSDTCLKSQLFYRLRYFWKFY